MIQRSVAVYIYLEFNRADPRSVKKWLEQTLKPEDYLLSVGRYYEITLLGGKNMLVDFRASLEAVKFDLFSTYRALVVPLFFTLFEQFVKEVGDDELGYLVNYASDEIYEASLNLLAGVEENILKTILVFIELGNSPQATGNYLYMHRNTVNYRIAKFIAKSGLDIYETPNTMFVYRLINLAYKKRLKEKI